MPLLLILAMQMYGSMCQVPCDTLDNQPGIGIYEYERAIPQGRWLVDYECGYLVPKPMTPARRWYATIEGDSIRVHWRCLWDFDDNGWMQLSDLATFGLQYQRPWNLSDVVRLSDIYGGPSDREFRYVR